MDDAALTGWLVSSLLLSLRISPVFAFAPPFSMVRAPAVFRVMLGVGLAACLAGALPHSGRWADPTAGALAVAAARELLVGLTLIVAFQIPFAALQFAGRAIDVQAGFGFAGLLDPQTRNQAPLTGLLFTLAAGLVFFALDGHLELVKIIGASIEAVPIGTAGPPDSLAPLFGLVSIAFLTGLGVGGFLMLSLFLIDLAVTMLSRTAPQMNVLVLGFQAKTLAFLLAFPVTMGVSASVLARLMRVTLETLPRLL